MIVRPLLFAAVAAALLTCLAGCGGSSSSSSSASSTSGGAARAAYVKEADAICRATDEVTATLNEELAATMGAGTPGTPREEAKLGKLIARLVFIGREEEQELAAIRPPAADVATITRWIDTGEEGLGDLEGAALALEEGDTAKFGDLFTEGVVNFRRSHRIAQDYGFKVCGAELQTIR